MACSSSWRNQLRCWESSLQAASSVKIFCSLWPSYDSSSWLTVLAWKLNTIVRVQLTVFVLFFCFFLGGTLAMHQTQIDGFTQNQSVWELLLIIPRWLCSLYGANMKCVTSIVLTGPFHFAFLDEHTDVFLLAFGHTDLCGIHLNSKDGSTTAPWTVLPPDECENSEYISLDPVFQYMSLQPLTNKVRPKYESSPTKYINHKTPSPTKSGQGRNPIKTAKCHDWP